MGVLKDLGTQKVTDICPVTGFPKHEKWLLNPLSHYDGRPVENWDKPGTELVNLTSPYGFLYYAAGSGDDFYCFDFKVINAGPRGEFIILDSTINSETGHFIQGGSYRVMPCNSSHERRIALAEAKDMVDSACDWIGEHGMRHTKKGWNQDPWYFYRSVAAALFEHQFSRYKHCKKCKRGFSHDVVSERQMRFGSKAVDAIIHKIENPEPPKVYQAPKKRRKK